MNNSANRVAVALGSNLGDSKRTLETAVVTLNQDSQIECLQCSSWYRTKPIGPPQPDYMNGCVLLSTSNLTPHQLLKKLQDIESLYGRERKERWGARTLDLDIILFDDLIIDEADLTIPHLRMQERAFVLVPLAEISPEWLDPRTGETILKLRDKIKTEEVVRVER